MDEALEAHWKAFGKYLKALIDEADLSLTEFAERADLTLTQVSRLVNGSSGTRRATLPRFVHALGIVEAKKIEELYNKAGFTPPQPKSPVEALEEYIDSGGKGGVELTPEGAKPATRAEVERLERKLDSMLEILLQRSGRLNRVAENGEEYGEEEADGEKEEGRNG